MNPVNCPRDNDYYVCIEFKKCQSTLTAKDKVIDELERRWHSAEGVVSACLDFADGSTGGDSVQIHDICDEWLGQFELDKEMDRLQALEKAKKE